MPKRKPTVAQLLQQRLVAYRRNRIKAARSNFEIELERIAEGMRRELAHEVAVKSEWRNLFGHQSKRLEDLQAAIQVKDKAIAGLIAAASDPSITNVWEAMNAGRVALGRPRVPQHNPDSLPAASWCKEPHPDGLACEHCAPVLESHLRHKAEHGT